jgi:hypothetical protein
MLENGWIFYTQFYVVKRDFVDSSKIFQMKWITEISWLYARCFFPKKWTNVNMLFLEEVKKFLRVINHTNWTAVAAFASKSRHKTVWAEGCPMNSPKNGEKLLAIFTQITSICVLYVIHISNIDFWEICQFFHRNLVKIAENSDQNIDPGKVAAKRRRESATTLSCCRLTATLPSFPAVANMAYFRVAMAKELCDLKATIRSHKTTAGARARFLKTLSSGVALSSA